MNSQAAALQNEGDGEQGGGDASPHRLREAADTDTVNRVENTEDLPL